MTISCRVMVLVAAAYVVHDHRAAYAQSFSPTTAPARQWTALASSEDGRVVAAAAAYGNIVISTNFGQQWLVSKTSAGTGEPLRLWTGLAMNRTGSRIVGVADNNPIFLSVDGGQTWSSAGPAASWTGVTASQDGSRWLACVNDGGIYASTDGGTTWQKQSAPDKRWRAVAFAGLGQRAVAVADAGPGYEDRAGIFVSEDAGQTWTRTSAPELPWHAASSSADGQVMLAGPHGGVLHLSKDAGQTWLPMPPPPSRWGAVAVSPEGTRLTATSWDGQILTSSDQGQNWAPAEAAPSPWAAVATTADGAHLYAAAFDPWDGGIHKAALQPRLHISPSASGAVLSWSASAAGYRLQMADSPHAEHWLDVQAQPVLVNGRLQVSVAPTQGHVVFRLVK